MNEIEELRTRVSECERKIQMLEGIIEFYRERDRKDTIADDAFINRVREARREEFKSVNQLTLEEDIRQGRITTVEALIDDWRNS